jgi:hypothetical protein
MSGKPLKYPVKGKTDFPTYYLKLTPKPWYIIRVGHFDLPYGLHIPDHTANIRAGLWFPPNSQRDTVEAYFSSEYGEVSIAKFTLDDSNYSGIASIFIGKSSKASISGFISPDGYSFGSSAIVGWSHQFYSLHEADLKDDGEAYSYLIYNQIGRELTRGFHVKLTHEKTWNETDSPNKYIVSMQFFPIQNLELLGSIENYERPKATTYSVMTHIFF